MLAFGLSCCGRDGWLFPPVESRLQQSMVRSRHQPAGRRPPAPRLLSRMSLAPLIAALVALAAVVAAAEQPKVISVHDGDTLRVVQDGQQTTIRLNGIDAPEIGQPFGTKSRDRLAELAMGKRVVIHADKPDRYGRLLARVEIDGGDVGRQMVADGLAWHYSRYSKDPTLAAAERQFDYGAQ